MISPTGLVLPPPPGGSERTPLVLVPWAASSFAAWPGAEQGVWVYFAVEKPRVVTGLRVGVGSASGNAKAGLYSLSGAILTQIAMSAETAVAGSNAKQDIPFAAAYTVVPFQTYAAFLTVDNGTATFWRTTTAAGAMASGFGISVGKTTIYVTPPTTQDVSALAGLSSGYTPIIGLY